MSAPVINIGTSSTAYILQGGIVVGLPAVPVYDAVGHLQAQLARRAGRI